MADLKTPAEARTILDVYTKGEVSALLDSLADVASSGESSALLDTDKLLLTIANYKALIEASVATGSSNLGDTDYDLVLVAGLNAIRKIALSTRRDWMFKSISSITTSAAMAAADKLLLSRASDGAGRAITWENLVLGIIAELGEMAVKNTVAEDFIENGAVTNQKLAPDAVTALKIADGSITTPKHADESVTGPKIANDAVTYDKLADISESLGYNTPVVAETAADGKIVAGRVVYPNAPRLNQMDMLEITSQANYGGAPVYGPNGKIVAVIPWSTGGFPVTYEPNDIRVLTPGVRLDGAMNQDTAIIRAHDIASAAGYQEILIEGEVVATDAVFLGNVHFRSATGRGKLTGAYRKRVIPLSATPLAPLVDVTPAHLARFNAAVSVATPAAPAHVVIMSDSWGNPNQRIGEHSQFEEQLRRALRAQYGSDADCINIVNRAIGGTTWEDAAGIPDESLPPWYTDGGADWLDYITTMDLTDDGFGAAEVPSLIILMFGMNQPEAMTAADFDWIEHVLDTLQAVSPQPDILMVAGATPSSMSATRGTRAAQEARLSYAGTTRAFAAVRNLGVIDFGRYFDAAHWGEDLRRGYFVRLAEEEVTALTYTWPQECRDFAFQMTVDGTDADFWATGDLVIQLSDVIGNTLVLDEDVGGNLAFTVYAATGKVSIARTVTGVDAVVGSDGIITFSVQGPSLIVQWRGNEVYNGPVHRGIGLFTPTISNGGTSDGTMNYAAIGEYPACVPSLTAIEAWGDASGDFGGNEENHLSEKGRAAIFTRALLETRFR